MFIPNTVVCCVLDLLKGLSTEKKDSLLRRRVPYLAIAEKFSLVKEKNSFEVEVL